MNCVEDLVVRQPGCKILETVHVWRLVKDDSGAVTGVEYESNSKMETAHPPGVLAGQCERRWFRFIQWA
jgi:hypothetical protein